MVFILAIIPNNALDRPESKTFYRRKSSVSADNKIVLRHDDWFQQTVLTDRVRQLGDVRIRFTNLLIQSIVLRARSDAPYRKRFVFFENRRRYVHAVFENLIRHFVIALQRFRHCVFLLSLSELHLFDRSHNRTAHTDSAILPRSEKAVA